MSDVLCFFFYEKLHFCSRSEILFRFSQRDGRPRGKLIGRHSWSVNNFI